MSILFYKRPDYIARENGPLSRSNCQKYVERAACSRAAMPQELSFENVMEGKTMPPCSIADFLDYLVYVSHDAENLQFFLWFRDYTKRFNALPPAQKRLSPKWMPDETPPDLAPIKKYTHVGQLLKTDTDKDGKMSAYLHDGPNTPILKPDSTVDQERFATQPFRKEISQITAHYLLPGAPRELNLSHRDRSALLQALSQTTHPSVFSPVLELTTMMLRNHSHPNFVRWSLCNGNKPRVIFLRSFAVWWLTVSVVMALLLILSHESRWIRTVVAPVLWFGITNLVAASKGLCVLLHRMHTREIHPWEVNTPAPGEDASKGWRARKKGSKEPDGDGKSLTIHLKPPTVAMQNNYTNLPSPPLDPSDKDKSKTGFDSDIEALSVLSGSTLVRKMSPFGPSNSFEHEPWVERWKRKGWWRKLSLRKVWVREEGLRLMQNRIVIQAELWAIMITVPVVVGIVACPVVGLY